MEYKESYILSYLQDKLSIDEKRDFELQLRHSPELKKKFDEIARIYTLSENLIQQHEVNTQASWNQLNRRIKRSKTMQSIWNFTRTAAAILLPLFLMYQYFLLPEINRNKIQQTITVTSAPGMVTKTVLPDGSEVWLNAESSLTYPVKFTHKTRTVKLAGEAYFKVSSDKKHRFDVITPHRITVSAYGTEFNVNSYTSANRYEVTLAKGCVEVSSDVSKGQEALTPGEKAIVEAVSGNIQVVSADTYAETAWKDGKIVFRRERFETITEKLSRKFGVTIILQDEKLKDYEYTVTFTDETLEQILELLKRSTPITYTISKPQQLDNDTFTKRVITIKSRKSTNNKSTNQHREECL